MATASNKPAVNKPVTGKQAQQGFVYLPLIAGWLVPGAGHFLLRKWVRGAAAVRPRSWACLPLGLAMQGKLYSSAHDVLDMLGLAGDLGNGLLLRGSRALGWARARCR